MIDIKTAIVNSVQELSKLPQTVLDMEGMSSNKVRCLLSNLASDANGYLEVGCWKGSTFVSAAYKNHKCSPLIAIDNFSEFGGPKSECMFNFGTFLSDVNHKFIEMDFLDITDEVGEKSIELFFYDGCHDEESQYKAIIHMDKYMRDEYVLVVDDWNHMPTQDGTNRAISNMNYFITEQYILPAKYNGDKDLYWNGIYIARIQR